MSGGEKLKTGASPVNASLDLHVAGVKPDAVTMDSLIISQAIIAIRSSVVVQT